MLAFEILFILFLIIVNGLFSMSELAVVSSRKTRLQKKSDEGHDGAATALDLRETPSTFLATIQVGITLTGIMAGVFGGASLAENLAAIISNVEFLKPFSATIAFGLVILIITYLSLVVGELVPKRLALAYPEPIAMFVAPKLKKLCSASRPLVWFLERSTELLVAPFKLPHASEEEVSEEDIQSMVALGSKAGVIEESEEQIIGRLFRMGDRTVDSLMTPRIDVEFISLDRPLAESIEMAIDTKRSWFPVVDKDRDDVLGIVSVHDLMLLQREKATDAQKLREHLSAPLKVHESITALRLLDKMKREKSHFSVIIDEFGGIAGVATIHDLIEALVGDLGDSSDELPEVHRRNDGSLLVDASINIEEIWTILKIRDRSPFEDNRYHSLGGFMMSTFGHIPKTGESFQSHGYNFEIVDMDGHRIDKVLVTQLPGQQPAPAE